MKPQHARPPFSLLAYGCNQSCRLKGDAEHQVELISIGAQGARLRFGAEAGSLLRFGERCLLDLNCALGGAAVEEIPCEVACLNGREAGIHFFARLDKSFLALQHVIGQGQLARKEAA